MVNRSASLVHINLAKGYRGGERQTEYSILESLKSKDFSTTAVLRRNSMLAQKLRSQKKLTIIEVSSSIDGHFKLHTNHSTILHAHDGQAVYWCYLHFLIFNTPYIITRRVDHPLKTNTITKLAYSSAKHCVGISKKIADQLAFYTSSVSIISSSSQVTTAEVTTQTLQIKKLFMAGALVDSHKGQTIAIDALKACDNDVTLDIYGDGIDKEFLVDYISMHKLSGRVNILPWTDNLIAISKNYDAFIMPSRYEGLGSIIIDIMRTKRLIIASRIGGITDLIQHGSTGLLFESGNAKDLSKKINSASKNNVANITEAAFRLAESLTPSNMQKMYEKIYSKILLD